MVLLPFSHTNYYIAGCDKKESEFLKNIANCVLAHCAVLVIKLQQWWCFISDADCGSAHCKYICKSKCSISWWGSEGHYLFSPLSDLCFKSRSLPLLKSDLLLRVAKSMFISHVNHSTFWRPCQQALLLRDCEETSPLSLSLSFANPPPRHTPLQIARVYVLGRPVNFLFRVHRYTDISGINLLLRIVMPLQMYTRLFYVIVYCLSGCWFTQEMVPFTLWTTQTRAGLTFGTFRSQNAALGTTI